MSDERTTITVPVTLNAETRSADGKLKLSGTAAVFDSPSGDLGFTEVLERGAFRDALADPDSDPMLLWAHDHGQPLARVSAGNLEIRETSKGLEFSANLVDTTTARDAIALIKAGVVRQMSFGFSMQNGADRWEQRAGQAWRFISRVGKLLEISITGSPAYAQTSVDARNLQQGIDAKVEKIRRDRLAKRPRSPYTPNGDFSYFRDLSVLALEARTADRRFQARLGETGPVFGEDPFPSFGHGGAAEARARLELMQRSLEKRDLTTTATAGGGFVPTAPVFIADAFALSVRAAAALPFVLPREPLPDKGMTIGAPRLTTGMDTAVQASENAANTEVDMVEAGITSPVSTIVGQQDVSEQLVDRANPVFDVMLAQELGRSLAADLDVLLLTGSGTAPNLRGLDNVSGITSVAYTDGTPTQAELWPKIAEAAARLSTALGRPPTHLLAHPRRLAWLSAWLDSAGNTVEPSWPFGIIPVSVSSINTLGGGGTNEDRIYVVCAPELPIMLGEVRFAAFPQVLSGTLSIRYRAFMYAAALFGRRPEAIAVVSGTGLTIPYP